MGNSREYDEWRRRQATQVRCDVPGCERVVVVIFDEDGALRCAKHAMRHPGVCVPISEAVEVILPPREETA